MAENGSEELAFGRKIFFLNPPYSFIKQNVATLRMLEYEVYVIGDYKNIKNILRLNKNSILFINMDTVLSRPAWRNFIYSIQNDPFTNTTMVGLFTKGISELQKEEFLQAVELPAGIVTMQGPEDTVTSAFVDQFDMCNAKGRRKYVRAECSTNRSAQMFLPMEGKMQMLQLMDISSVGCSAKLPRNFPGKLEKNMLIKNVSLQLQHEVATDVLCFAIKQGANYDTAVFLFIQASSKAKNAIREYTGLILQQGLNDSISGMPQDDIDYNAPLSVFKKKKVQYSSEDSAFLVEAEDDGADLQRLLTPPDEGEISDFKADTEA